MLDSQPDFSQETTRIHLLYRRSSSALSTQRDSEFVMRRHAVILAAALAWLVSVENAAARLDILVDKATQRMLVIQDGYMRYIWPVSTGRDETATPNGVYTPQRLERNWFSTAYYNSPMPYSIFFHNGYAIHGSYAIDRLGGPASHGCVRLHPHHAALLFELVQQEGPANTTIEVTDEARPDGPPSPGHEITAGRGPYPPVPRIVRYRETGDMPEPPPAQRAEARPDEPSLPGREVAAGRGYPPVPRMARYRETNDMPELPPAHRGNRPIVAMNAWPQRPPARRRMLADVRPPANVPRSPRGAGQADTENGSPRPSDESSDSRPKPRVAEGSSPEPAQPAPSVQAFKLLPSSCWSGGASRWRWWGSSQGTPCK
jgi:lipoprotein-anchoring transpeptidase ErfK/SrfK